MNKENSYQPGVGGSGRKASYFPVLPMADMGSFITFNYTIFIYLFPNSIFSVSSHVEND